MQRITAYRQHEWFDSRRDPQHSLIRQSSTYSLLLFTAASMRNWTSRCLFARFRMFHFGKCRSATCWYRSSIQPTFGLLFYIVWQRLQSMIGCRKQARKTRGLKTFFLDILGGIYNDLVGHCTTEDHGDWPILWWSFDPIDCVNST